jgi:hypothetical protein
MLLDIPDPMPVVPISRNRFQGEIPKLEMRINAKFKSDGRQPPQDAPSYSAFPLKFVRKLLGAKISMMLHR